MYNKVIRRKLKDRLLKLDNRQFKLFYGMLVHYWVKYKFFISSQNFLNLWCELNYLCSEVDESFPDPYNDYQLLKNFWRTHPYYFIDCLPRVLVAKLFAKYCDKHLDVLATFIQLLREQNACAANQYIIDIFKLDHTADEFSADMENHIEHNS